MNYSGSAPARFRGLAHRGKMAVFTYKMFPFWGRLAIQNDNWGLWNPLTYCLRMRARPPQKPVHAVKRVYAHKYFCVFTLAPAISDAPFFSKKKHSEWELAHVLDTLSCNLEISVRALCELYLHFLWSCYFLLLTSVITSPLPRCDLSFQCFKIETLSNSAAFDEASLLGVS